MVAPGPRTTRPAAADVTETKRRLERDDDDDQGNYYSEDEDIPLHRKRPFGSGIKRTKVEFVRAQAADDTAAAASARRDKATAISDLYASVVLGGSSPSAPATPAGTDGKDTSKEEAKTCSVCSLPIIGSEAEHNVTLAHQVSLEHSHPPSALDRSRMGLKALESQGWNPDARRGLGREGEGMRYPIKTVAKDDTLGIGAVIPDEVKEKKVEQPKKLTGKEMKKQIKKDKERLEELQKEIYGRADIEKYLRDGSGGGDGLR